MSVHRARILVLSYTPLASAPRALKQVRHLRDAHDVTTAGFGSLGLDGVPHVELDAFPAQRWSWFGRLIYLALLALRIHGPIPRLSARDRQVATLLGVGDWDIVIAHDLWTLAAALRLQPRHGVVLDLHEYAPREGEHSWIWRVVMAPYMRWMLRSMVPRVAKIVTVSEGIAAEYHREFGIDSEVVVNSAPFSDLPVRQVAGPIRLVHSGIAAPARRLDIMVDAVHSTEADVTLDLYLVPSDTAEYSRLVKRADGDERIRFHDPVPYEELAATLNLYDVGISVLPPTTFNLAWSLPNKFFDFVQARLGVIVGPSPEMAHFVERYGIGQVLPDFTAASLASAVAELDGERINRWKAASDAHAQELSSEAQVGIWDKIVDELLGSTS